MKKQGKGIGFYITLVFMLLLILSLWDMKDMLGNNYAYNDYKAAVDAGLVESATISQNATVPSGKINLNLKDGKVVSVAVPDVNEEGDYLVSKNVTIRYYDVPKEN